MSASSDTSAAQQQVLLGVDELLPHSSINANSKTTVMLIHGAFGDRNAWDMVIPEMETSYHLLVPDQISHGKARHIRPYTLGYSAETLAQLIKQQGHGGVAHVVGHSLGASVALQLAAKYPEVVRSMVVSGISRLERNRMIQYLPYTVWLEQRLDSAIPRSATRWLMDGTGLPKADLSLCTVDLNRQIFDDGLSTNEWPDSWNARTLIIAATKRGIIPSNDDVVVATTIAKIGRQLNSETFAVTHSGMRHPWIRQDPKLFADVVMAWIEEKQLPAGF